MAEPDHLPDDLRAVSALLTRAAPRPVSQLPPDLGPRVFNAIAAEAEAGGREAHPRRRSPARLLAVAAAVAAGFVLATVFEDRPGRAPLELRAELVGSGKRATAEVTELGIGREIAFRTDDLPILPKGEFYELWFVGPGDRPGAPNRISAGTFHPDEQGRSDVRFTAAVDPAKYPTLAVTAEPGDGRPQPDGPDVLRSRG